MELLDITSLELYKFLTGASFGLLFFLIGLLTRKPKAIKGALLVTIFFGIVAIFVPVLVSIWVNLIVLTLAQMVIVLSIAPK
jgi:hypothetical protein